MLKKIVKLYKKLKMKMEKKKKTKADQLPLSLIELEILPRLPAKSIGRFMCVSKQWKSFLSTPAFARMHLHHVTINDYKLLTLHHHRPVIFHTHSLEPLNDVSKITPNFDRQGCFAMLGTLDGLVCLALTPGYGTLVFWNLLAGSFKRLSANPFNRFPINLGVIGFYKDHSNDYKLLCLRRKNQHYVAYIYSNRLDSWRNIEFLVESNIDRISTHAIFWDQCLYFTVIDMFIERETWAWILCFDVKTEKFRNIQCPVIPGGAKDYYRSLVVLNGCVHLCVSYKILNMKHVDVWRMDDDVGWVNAIAFSCNKCTRPCVSTASIGNWLAILEGTNSFKKMNTEDFLTHCWDFCCQRWDYPIDQMIYVETLVSPNP